MPLSAVQIRNVFRRPVAPVETTPHYRVRLLSLLAGLAALQLLYLALVAAMLAGIAAYAFFGVGLMTFGVVGAILYLGPLVAGLVALVFLMKPLFNRPAAVSLVELRAEEEPLLFDFIGQLCDAVGSPRPSRVFVDLKVNAGAGVSGWRGFFAGRFNLTIGLPLAAGLSLQQFTGVLAHEFGHFAQRAGLRSYFLIQNMRNWFSRVVHQRDRMDATLERYYRSRDPRAKLVAGLARMVVALSRRYLALLMKAGQWLGAGFSRQMEFDADRREASIVGADVFEQTTRLLPVLECTSNLAWQDAGKEWAVRRLPDDVPALSRMRTELLPDETRDLLVGRALEARTGRWDTHPCATERIANARTMDANGIFDIDQPAAELFTDFAALCVRATRHHYQTISPMVTGDVRYVASEESLRGALEVWEFERAAGEVLHAPAQFCAQWLRLAGNEPRELGGAAEAKAGEFDHEAFANALNTSVLRYAALQIVEAGVRVKPESFCLQATDLDSVRRAESAAARRLEEVFAELNRAAEPVAARIETTIARLLKGELVIVVAGSHVLELPQAKWSWECYSALSYSLEAVAGVRRRLQALRNIRSNLKLFRAAECANLLERLESEALGMIEAVAVRAAEAPSVVTFHEGAPTLQAQLIAPQGSAEERIEVFLSRFETLAARSLAQLAWLAKYARAIEEREERVAPGATPDGSRSPVV